LLNLIVSFFLKFIDFEKLLKPYIHRIGKYVRIYRNNFYVVLAIGFLIYIAATLFIALSSDDIKKGTYDFAIKNRISSPAPSSQIIIIDIDEKSIAELSGKLGRWPWPRQILAEVIVGIQEFKPNAIYLNMLLSEGDLSNKNSDGTLSFVLKEYSNVVIPWLRLNPKNDKESKFLESNIPGFIPNSLFSAKNEQTVALIPSLFSDKKNNHGFSNLKEDGDGIIRRFYSVLDVPNGFVPSSSLVTAGIYNSKTADSYKEDIFLNWRNKKGTYTRISFSDLYEQLASEKLSTVKNLENAIVIIGVSAPGIANLKPTASSSLMDDNEIIATAIDDFINSTNLKLTPIWVDKIISASLIILFCLAFIFGSVFLRVNTLVGIVQSALVLITLGFVSFTNYFIDLSGSIGLSLSFFAICKFHQSIDRRAIRAEDLFSFSNLPLNINYYSLIVFSDKDISEKSRNDMIRSLETNLGPSNVYLIDNIFEGSNFFGSLFKPLSTLIVLTSEATSYLDSKFLYQDKYGLTQSIQFPISKTSFTSAQMSIGGKMLNDSNLKHLLSKETLKLTLNHLDS